MQKGVVLYVCSMCGGLGMINDSTWDEVGKGIPPLSPGSAPGGAQTFEPCLDDIESWEHWPEFGQMIRGSNDENIPNFPLCDHCAEIAAEHTLKMNELVRQFVDDVGEISRYGDDFTSKILTQGEFLSPFSIQTPKQKEESDSDKHSPRYVLDGDDFMGIEPARREITPRFAQLAAFKFSIDGQFGTINGQRLGTLKCCPVSVQELQTALHVLCRFLVYQMRVVGLDPMNIKIGAKIQFLTKDGVRILKVPEKTKEIGPFNEALTLMMGAFNSVFNSKFMEKMRPANLIDTEKCTISGDTYLWSKSNPEHFTSAMRKLVVNLKTIQAYETIFSLPTEE